MNRIILHSDLNNFYASVECILHPELKDKYVAVCGSEKDRQGIVLAKNQKAKQMGVSTGQTIREAKLKCPMLTIVPPEFEQYTKYSNQVRQIYLRYTNQVEPFGMDECWLDVTGSQALFGSGKDIAESIRQTVKKETGLTVSVGVSFNKVFAKLASDMKKPDAVTQINIDEFREKIWHLPAPQMLGVGPKFGQKLKNEGIYTIGDIANMPLDFMIKRFGKIGLTAYEYANGRDFAPVHDSNYDFPIKSIGNGVTCTSDLTTKGEIKNVILYLCENVSHRLRKNHVKAGGIAITIKNKNFVSKEYSAALPYPTVSIQRIADFSYKLFCAKHKDNESVRAVSVRAINLQTDSTSIQTSLFFDIHREEKKLRAEDAMAKITDKFGKRAITYASLLGDIKVAHNPHLHNDEQIYMP